MNIKKIFVTNGRLRAGWRIGVFLILSIIIFLIIRLLIYLLLPSKHLSMLETYLIIFLAVLASSFLAARYLDKRPITTIGYMFHSRWLKEYLLGVLIGVVLISIIFFFEMSIGYIKVRFNTITPLLLKNIFIYSLLLYIIQSAFEELAFRGYIFQNFIEGANALIATAVLSTLFGALHLMNEHASWVVALNITVFGILHALGYICTKSLWLPSGLHFSWNYFMLHIYSLPMSGIQPTNTNTLLLVEQKGPTWITGGNFGPEAGVPALILLIASCFLIYYWKKIKVAPEMKKLWENYYIQRITLKIESKNIAQQKAG